MSSIEAAWDQHTLCSCFLSSLFLVLKVTLQAWSADSTYHWWPVSHQWLTKVLCTLYAALGWGNSFCRKGRGTPAGSYLWARQNAGRWGAFTQLWAPLRITTPRLTFSQPHRLPWRAVNWEMSQEPWPAGSRWPKWMCIAVSPRPNGLEYKIDHLCNHGMRFGTVGWLFHP